MRNLKSIASAVAFMVLWAGAALALPTSAFSPDEEPSTVAELVEDGDPEVIEVEPTPETDTVDATVSVDDDQEGSDEGDEKADNHGKAVSTAAHCDLKGRAKGQLVSSVARDKEATVESAQAACDAAIAAAAGVSSKPVKAPKPPKAERAPKPEKASKPEPKSQHSGDTEESPEVEDTEAQQAPAPDAGPPAHAGPPADKGSKKP